MSEQLEMAQQLVRYGVDPHVVAATFDMPVRDIATLASGRTTTFLSPEDAELASAMRRVAWMAVEKAMETLQYGNPRDKQQLIRAILSRTMGLVGVETTQRFDEMRNEFETMLVDLRGDEKVLEDPPYVGTSPAAIPTDDPN